MTDLKKYLVLFVENNPNDIVFVERAIQQTHLPIDFVVRNGEEAVHYLRGDESFSNRERYPLPLLVLSDMNMPKKTG